MKIEINAKHDANQLKSLKSGKIYEFSDLTVITGANGSGKTQLLCYIRDNIIGQNAIHQQQFSQEEICSIDHDWQPKTVISTKQLKNSSEDIHRSFRNQALESFQKKQPHQLIKIAAEHYKKQESEITAQEIKDVLIPPDIKYSLSSVDELRRWFLSYIENRHTRSDNAVMSGDQDEAKKIKDEKSPIDLVNDLLRENDFLYEMLKIDAQANDSSLKLKSRGDGKEVELNDLSSGEKMIVSIVLWAHNPNTGKRVKLMFLDEPDAHLHPSMSEMMIKIMQKTLVKKYGIQVIMTTHSPSTVAYAKKFGAKIKWMENGEIIEGKKSDEIINELSSGLITVQDIEKDLQLLIKNKKKYVIYTEGKNDETHLSSAIKALGMTEKFEDVFIFGCTGAETIKLFISMPTGQEICIALFDQDEKGKEEFKKTNERIKEINKEVYYKCFFCVDGDGLEIENLFDKAVLTNNKMLDENGDLKGDKTKFANKMAKHENLTAENFKNFKPLLEKILKEFEPKNE